MKRVLASILTLFYLALSSSATIDMHYCGGELESIKINSEPKVCCCGEKEMQSSCCQDKELYLELDIDQQAFSIINLLPEDFASYTLFNSGNDIIQRSVRDNLIVEEYIIPPPKLEAIWIKNCSLIFYG